MFKHSCELSVKPWLLHSILQNIVTSVLIYYSCSGQSVSHGRIASSWYQIDIKRSCSHQYVWKGTCIHQLKPSSLLLMINVPNTRIGPQHNLWEKRPVFKCGFHRFQPEYTKSFYSLFNRRHLDISRKIKFIFSFLSMKLWKVTTILHKFPLLLNGKCSLLNSWPHLFDSRSWLLVKRIFLLNHMQGRRSRRNWVWCLCCSRCCPLITARSGLSYFPVWATGLPPQMFRSGCLRSVPSDLPIWATGLSTQLFRACWTWPVPLRLTLWAAGVPTQPSRAYWLLRIVAGDAGPVPS